MSYGLDLNEVRYETDHAGNRLKATMPYTMFSALTEFWIAARRAQTAAIEASARPGQFKGSLQSSQIPTPGVPEASRPHSPPRNQHERHWQNMLARLPIEVQSASRADAVSTAQPVTTAVSTTGATGTSLNGHSTGAKITPAEKTVPASYREFEEAPPAEVAQLIARGVYFTRAWREYRELTLDDAAELYGCSKATIIWHESGKAAPRRQTLEKLAQIYDCPIAQMTPRAASDTLLAGARSIPETAQNAARPNRPRTLAEPRSPADTVYPDGVYTHLLAGKSPMLAWRLYRDMSLQELAEAYGGVRGNIRAMERNTWLRRATIDRLCAIFHCRPEQMLRPEGLPTGGKAILPSEVLDATSPPGSAPPAGERAQPVSPACGPRPFMHDHPLEERAASGKKERARTGRLARMQRELAGR